MTSVKSKKKLLELIGAEDDTLVEVVSLEQELALACKKFRTAAKSKPILKRLILIDPIRALMDAGVSLSKRAKKQIRRNHPDMAYGNEELYNEVGKDLRRLPWIKDVRMRKPCRKFLRKESGSA